MHTGVIGADMQEHLKPKTAATGLGSDFIQNLLRSFSSLSGGQAARAFLRLTAFSVATKNLTVSEMGTFLSAVAICELFQFLTLPGINKVVLRNAVRNLNETADILASAAPLRNVATFCCIGIVVLFAQIFVSDNQVRYLVFIYSSLFFFDAIREYARVAIQAHEKFHILAISEVFYSAAYCTTFTTAAVMWGTAEALAFAAAVAAAIGMIFDAKSASKLGFVFSINLFAIPYGLIKASIVFTLTNTAFLIISKIDMFMLSFLASAEEIAQYGVAQRLIFIGLMCLSVASTIAYPWLLRNTENLSQLVRKNLSVIILWLCAFNLFILFMSRFIGGDLIILIADSRYVSAIAIFNILTIFLCGQTIVTPLKLILYAADKELLVLSALVPCAVLKGPLNYILYSKLGAGGIAVSTCIVYGVFAITLFLVSLRVSRDFNGS